MKRTSRVNSGVARTDECQLHLPNRLGRLNVEQASACVAEMSRPKGTLDDVTSSAPITEAEVKGRKTGVWSKDRERDHSSHGASINTGFLLPFRVVDHLVEAIGSPKASVCPACSDCSVMLSVALPCTRSKARVFMHGGRRMHQTKSGGRCAEMG
jgi:hypothetical protein